MCAIYFPLCRCFRHVYVPIDLVLGSKTTRFPHSAGTPKLNVTVPYTQLRLARPFVADRRLPWERRRDPGTLTPYRVRRALSALLAQLGSPANAPKPCGRSPGRPKGARSGRARRFPAIKRAA